MASDIEQLRLWLSKANFDAILAYAREHKRVLSYLTALTYDQDDTLSWRAIGAIGLAATQIAEDDPEYVRIHLRRLVWLLNDESGGISWRAPETIGEIIYHRPALFKAFIPILVNLMDMEHEDSIRFRAGWLWAINRLAEVRLKDANAALPWIIPCLEDPDPQVRGMALWCLGMLDHRPPANSLGALLSDQEQVALYKIPDMKNICIADLAKKLVGGT